MVQNPAGLSVADAVRRYKSNPNVLYVEPDYTVSTTATPTDPLWSQQWDMQKIAAPTAWNVDTVANDVVVAVIDTGVDYTHPDLQANLWTNPADGSHGFTCMNGTCAAGGLDDFGHGTHVAGTIGAVADNGIGIAGINWHAQILSCKFLGSNGSGNTSDAILCFNQIVSLKQKGVNIRLTSNSWGGGGYSQALKDALTAAENAGILNVCAAGNDGVNADVSPMYPGGFDNRGIVSVLASDANDLGASFTNYGLANVDIAAPGVSTLSTVPTGTCSLCDPSGYLVLSGTSMATPHVTAVLAAMFHMNPSLTAYQARDAVLDPGSYDALTDPLGSMTSTGGRLNFAKAITNPLLSAPKLNNFPTITGISDLTVTAGSMVNLTATATDPDNDPLRMAWASGGSSLWLLGWGLGTVFPNPSGNALSFQAPPLARTVMTPYSVSVADGRGGGATASSNVTILSSASAGQPPSGTLSVAPLSGPVGTSVTVNFPLTDPQGGSTAWDLWQTGIGGFGRCCLTGGSFSFPINGAGVYRLTAQAIDNQLNFSNRQSAVVRIGGATGTPPIAGATFDTLTGPAPLTVNVDMSSSTDPDGTVQSYTINCDYGSGSGSALAGPQASCIYNTPGTYWIMMQAKDNDGLIDVLSAYAVVTPTGTVPPPPPPATGAIVIRNTTMGGTGTFSFSASGGGLYSFSVTTTIPGTPVSTTFTGLATGSSGGSRAVAQGTLPAGWQFTSLQCTSSTGGSTISTSGSSATVTSLGAGDTVTCTYTNTAATQSVPPGVAITNPLTGSVKRSATVSIQATAKAGSNPIAHVDFVINGTLKCSDTTAPYSCSWTVPGSIGKAYQIQAKVYDTAGLSAASSVVTVTSTK